MELAAQVPFAETHREIEILDFGRPDARPFLGRGWSWDETSGDTAFVWGIGEESEVYLFLSRARDLELELRCFPFRWPGSPPQKIAPRVNGVELAALTLGGGPAAYRLAIPERALHSGRNRLVFRYAYSRSPREVSASGDRRRLAVAWDRLRIAPGISPETPAATPGGGIDLPLGTQIDFFFAASGRDRLTVDRVRLPRPAAGRLVVATEVDGRAAVTVAVLDGDAEDLRLGLRSAAAEPLRLSLRAEPGFPGGELRGSIRVGGARIERPVTGGEKAAAAPAAAPEPPNVLLYVVDTLRADHLGIYGYPEPTSPRIDELAAEAVVFDRAIAHSSWTKPTVASMLTGLRPLTHGVNHRRHRLPDSIETLAERLRGAGYATAGFATNAYFSAGSGLRQGFDTFGFDPTETGDNLAQATAWLERLPEERPFFLYFHTIEPHGPYQPPPSFRRRWAPHLEDDRIGSIESLLSLAGEEIARSDPLVEDLLALYDAEIAFADRRFGALVDELRRLSSYDETLVIFTADHGEGFYDHGIRGHGWDLYGEAIEVPLIIKPPGGGAHRRIGSPVQQVDLPATILDLAGVEPAAPVQGVSLAPFLADRGEPAATGYPIFSYLDYDDRKGVSVVAGRWKLIQPLAPSFLPQRALFDLVDDPGETHDLAREHPVRAGYLAALARRELASEPLAPAQEHAIDGETRRHLEALGYLD